MVFCPWTEKCAYFRQGDAYDEIDSSEEDAYDEIDSSEFCEVWGCWSYTFCPHHDDNLASANKTPPKPKLTAYNCPIAQFCPHGQIKASRCYMATNYYACENYFYHFKNWVFPNKNLQKSRI